MSSQSSGEGEIRKRIIEKDLVDCIVTLPSQLFFNVAIPCCLWFISRDRTNRSGKILFIDARNLGHMINRKNRELSKEDIAKIADVYHDFRSGDVIESSSVIASEAKQSSLDQPGFSKVATLEEIKQNDYVLTPGRYVGFEAAAEDTEPFEEKLARLTAELDQQFAKSHKLEDKIKDSLKKA
jgi:type I restriction enzyme M protein